MVRTRSIAFHTLLGVILLTGACSTEGPPTGPEAEPDDPGTQPPSPPPPPPSANALAGKVAYEAECSGCHAARDAFDMAFFAFADADIIRRAVGHVDSTTARNIVEYVHTLTVSRTDPSFRPFQPGGTVAATDQSFWSDAFGTSSWPASLTASQLKAMDPTDVAIPVALPRWSSEADDSDWMPDTPLPDEVLDAAGGSVRTALDTYYASPTDAALDDVLTQFRSVTTGGSGRVCRGDAGTHGRAEDCFQVRRWMSSLAAQHYLRPGATPTIPLEVAEIWWDTGEAAVSVRLTTGRKNDVVAQTNTASWLYLGFASAPGAFAADEGYMSEHFTLLGLPRLAVFTTLRRMVSGGTADQEDGSRRYWDALGAAYWAPNPLKTDVAEFSFNFLLEGLKAGTVPATGREKDRALYAIDEAHFLGTRDLAPNHPTRTLLRQLRDEIIQRIG